MNIRHERTDFGFIYGAAEYRCITADDKVGWTIVEITTPKGRWQVYVTKTGKVRFFDTKAHKELVKEDK